MKETPASKSRNTPQNVQKSIQPQHEIVLNISDKVSGRQLEKMLQGVSAFSKGFDATDQYEVNIHLVKLLKEEKQDAEIQDT